MTRTDQPLPKLSDRRYLYENPYHSIYHVTADFGAFKKEYYVDDSGQRAGIVAIRDDKVLLVKQYRLLINGESLEIPGGGVDNGENPEDTAVRECFEETGVLCHEPRPLIYYYSGLDTPFNPNHMFYSTKVSFGEVEFRGNPKEVYAIEWVSLIDCLRMIRDRSIIDGFTIIALLAYRDFVQGH